MPRIVDCRCCNGGDTATGIPCAICGGNGYIRLLEDERPMTNNPTTGDDVAVLSYALLWLRNHYATHTGDATMRDHVLARVDAVLGDYPTSGKMGDLFRKKYPQEKFKR
jgi:hypothetical protein